jgi:cell division septum initiation protein DivIVA
MTNSAPGVREGRQTPTAIRDDTFQRRLLGIDADRVYEYLDLLADQVQATERELDEARAENERLQAELQRVQRALDEYEEVGDRVNEQVVQLFSQAQLIAEEMVEDVSRDARERIGEARAHERRIVEQAMDTAGEQVRSYARSAQAQMQSVMESFASEVDQLGRAAASGEPAAATPQAQDPQVDDHVVGRRVWQPRSGDGLGSPGSD